MGIEQLMGRYFRLQQELARAYNARPWQSTRIDRLAGELAATEREIASQWPDDALEGAQQQVAAIEAAARPAQRAESWH